MDATQIYATRDSLNTAAFCIQVLDRYIAFFSSALYRRSL